MGRRQHDRAGRQPAVVQGQLAAALAPGPPRREVRSASISRICTRSVASAQFPSAASRPARSSPGTFASTGLTTEVKSTEMHHKALPEATTGMSIGFNVKNVAVKDIRRGFVCSNSKADPARPPVDTSRRSICSTILARSSAATRPSSTATHRVRIRRDRVQYRPPLRQRDREGAQVHQERRRRHRPHGPAEAMCVETFTEYPPLGRFAVREMHQTDVKGTI